MEEDYTGYLKLINNCSEQDPLLSTTKLGDNLNNILLDSINLIELNKSTHALNVEQLIRTKNGLARDYRGLAELMGFSSEEIITRFGKSYNPTKSIVDSFINRNLDEKGNCYITLNNLIKLIEKLERFDVIDDLLPLLVNLASNRYNNNQGQLLIGNGQRISNNNKAQDLVSDVDRLTIDDTSQVTTLYDAFMCYAPNDIQYAQELISLLEERNAKIATADDLLPGHFEHDALMKLIEKRCKKVITILTPNFLQSEECLFLTKFAGESAIRDGCLKIIPVLYETCEHSKLPSIVKVMSKIDMTDRGSQRWQMKRLINSLGLNFVNYSNDNSMTLNNHNSDINRQQSLALTHKPSTVAINTLSETNTDDSAISGSGPIIDLFQSYQNQSQISESMTRNHLQPSWSIIDSVESNQSSSSSFIERKSPSGGVSSKLTQTIRGMVSKVFGNQSSIHNNATITHDTSSHIMLLSPSSSDYNTTDSINNIDSK